MSALAPKASKVHPAAKAFPLMGGTEFDEFVEDIRKNGVQVPVVMYQGILLDGRNRVLACDRLGIPCPFEEWSGKGSPISYVASVNAHRRHLTQSQRAAIGAELKPLYEAEGKERKREHAKTAPGRPKLRAVRPEPNTSRKDAVSDSKERHSRESSALAARSIGASPRYVDHAAAVKKADPVLFERVKSGAVTLPAAVRQIDPPKKSVTEEVDAQPGMKWARLLADLASLAVSINRHGITKLAAKWRGEQRDAVLKQLKRLMDQLTQLTEALS